jgi:3-dehydroquinate synthase II
MKKKFWVKSIPFNKEIVTTALESGADAIMVPTGYTQAVKRLGIIKTIAEDGDIKLGRDVVEIEINNKDDELRAVAEGKSKTIIVRTTNWKIIPLENILSQCPDVILEVRNSEEAKIASQILEHGCAGVLLNIQKEKSQ